MNNPNDTVFCNLTPHEIVVRLDNGTNTRIPPYGEVLRVDTRSAQVAITESGVRINAVRPIGFSIESAVATVRAHLESERTIVLLSGIALDWIYPHLTESERLRVVSPDTSPGCAIRDTSGRIMAVRALRIGVGA